MRAGDDDGQTRLCRLLILLVMRQAFRPDSGQTYSRVCLRNIFHAGATHEIEICNNEILSAKTRV